MPRKPSPAARFGTRFHAWVESRRRRAADLLDPDDLPGRADVDIADDADLRELIEAFEAGPYGDRVRSRSRRRSPSCSPDRSCAAGSTRSTPAWPGRCRVAVVDWKTNRTPDSDPLQLALYRLAWAELRGVPPERVRAQFYFVRTDTVVEPADLPGRADLERVFRPD